MKRHVFIYWITITLCISSCLVGCQAKKNIEKTQENTTIVGRVETTTDSTRTEQKTTEREERQRNESERSYTRTTEYDSTGNVRRVSEEWRDRQSADISVQDNSSETISVTGSENEVVEEESSSAVTEEKIHTQADSRPIQGVEWLWVALGLGLLLTIVIFVVFKKSKSKWPI